MLQKQKLLPTVKNEQQTKRRQTKDTQEEGIL
jgi:hypothetical protein